MIGQGKVLDFLRRFSNVKDLSIFLKSNMFEGGLLRFHGILGLDQGKFGYKTRQEQNITNNLNRTVMIKSSEDMNKVISRLIEPKKTPTDRDYDMLKHCTVLYIIAYENYRVAFEVFYSKHFYDDEWENRAMLIPENFVYFPENRLCGHNRILQGLPQFKDARKHAEQLSRDVNCFLKC